MNLHVKSNSHGTLIFSIPREVANTTSVYKAITDKYHLSHCEIDHEKVRTTFEITPVKPEDRAVILKQGLTVNDTWYPATIPSPPGFNTIKVNFKRIPTHFKTEDTLNFLCSYGVPLEICMYYFDNPKGKIYTNEGFVLFEKPKGTSHFNLPKEVKVGPGKPVVFSINNSDIPIKSTAATTFTPKPSTSNTLPNTLPAKKSQQQDAEGFTKVTRKRTGKKRIRLSKESSSMDGIESTSTPTPITLTESIQQVVIPIQQSSSLPSKAAPGRNPRRWILLYGPIPTG
ncbi:hypothetical protein FBU30_007437 [Linnemannia zychae]|nr:hypothetical protein FBU30_007437 [Linnemannia zychae]